MLTCPRRCSAGPPAWSSRWTGAGRTSASTCPTDCPGCWWRCCPRPHRPLRPFSSSSSVTLLDEGRGRGGGRRPRDDHDVSKCRKRRCHVLSKISLWFLLIWEINHVQLISCVRIQMWQSSKWMSNYMMAPCISSRHLLKRGVFADYCVDTTCCIHTNLLHTLATSLSRHAVPTHNVMYRDVFHASVEHML